jgi:phosphoribosylanthranilate isomerase
MKRVKICGVNSAEAYDAAAAAGADYVGFVFFPASPRYVTNIEAKLLAARGGGPQTVGLFVAPSLEEVDDVLQDVSLDILQVHGAPELVAALRDRFGRPVWRALGVAAAADFPGPAEVADGFVIEAKPPPGATRPGGNAVRADWDLLAGFQPPKPWLLAGGLDADNVAGALRRTGAAGADVSSGVERAPGVKDAEMIRRFVAAVKAL